MLLFFELRARVGLPLRFVFAILRSSVSLIDLTMLFDAPRRELFDFLPRFAANAAPAAICCFLDFAGILNFQTTRLIRSCNVMDTQPRHVHNPRP